MIFRALDSDGDFTFGRGRQNYLRRVEAIRADIRTALLLFLRDAFWDMDSGIDWWNLCGGRQPRAQADLLSQTRRTILSREGVTQINFFDVVYTPGSRNLSIQYSVSTVYSGILEDIIDGDPFAFSDSSGNFLVDENSNYLVPNDA